MKCSINFACIENENICLFTLDKKGRYTKFCSNNWTKLRNLCRVKLNKNDQDLSQFWTIIKISCLFFMVLIFCIPQLNFMLLCIKWPIEQNYIAQLEEGCFAISLKKNWSWLLTKGMNKEKRRRLYFTVWKNEKFIWIFCHHLLKLSEKPS